MSAPTLTEFLLTRIAEDEATARYAETRGAPTNEDFAGWWLGHYDHANRHSPARVLAECKAKRRIVDRLQHTAPDHWAYDTLLDLAAVYADHPDYDKAWRP